MRRSLQSCSGPLTGWVSLRFGGIFLGSGRLSDHETSRQCFLPSRSRQMEIPSKTSQGPAPKGQTLIKLRARGKPCAELCAESNADRLPALPRVPRHTLLPKSRDERLFALWHRLFASGAKGRWFESTRAYHILKDLERFRFRFSPSTSPALSPTLAAFGDVSRPASSTRTAPRRGAPREPSARPEWLSSSAAWWFPRWNGEVAPAPRPRPANRSHRCAASVAGRFAPRQQPCRASPDRASDSCSAAADCRPCSPGTAILPAGSPHRTPTSVV